MKNFAKKTLYGILLSSFVMGGFLVFFSLIPQAHADSLSGYTFLAPLPANPSSILTDLSDYLKYLFITVVGVAIVLAVIVIVIGGIQYSMAIVPSGKEAGKKKVTSAIFGLLLILMSYVIIDAVNPQLLQVGLNIPHIDLPQGTTGGGSGGGGGGGGGQFAPNTLCVIAIDSCSTGTGCTTYQDADTCTQNEQLADSQGVPNCNGDLTGWQKCIAKTCSATTATFPKKCSVGAGNGTCTPITNGPCSVANLTSYCGGDVQKATNASKICNAESGGSAVAPDPNHGRSADCCGGPSGCSSKPIFSWGLFQINLTVHDVGGLNCHWKHAAGDRALTAVNYACSVDNQTRYNACVVAAQDPVNNIQEMLRTSNGCSNWGQWSTHTKCGL